MTLSTKNTPSSLISSPTSPTCDVVIALLSRTELVLGVFIDTQLVVTHREITTSLLQVCEEILSGINFHVSQISRLGIVNAQSSFTSTRLLMLFANMSASFGQAQVALLPSDFFEGSAQYQRDVFLAASFSDSLLLGYNGEPNITTPKK